MDSFAPAARPRSEDGVTHPPPHRTDDAADDSAAAFLQRIGSLSAGTLERAAMDAAPDGIVLADRQGRILMVNALMETISGYTNAQLCGQSIDLLVPVHARPEHGQHMQRYHQSPSRRPMGMGRDLWLQRRDGSQVPVDIALGHSSSHGGTVVAFVRDVSDLRRLEARMHYQATHDTLTGLLNRWTFGQRLEQAIAEQAAAQSPPFALLLLDLDDFKAINDGYGHAAGDQVLQEVARRLRGALGTGDILARLGGDEFTVLLPGVASAAQAEGVAARLMQALCVPCRVQGFELNFGASMGIALCPQDAGDAATLLRYADMAMYHAKHRGRANFAFYAPSMGRKMAEKIQLHDRLKLALAYGGLTLHYQPQVEVATNRMVGVEALLRWHDPQLGEVSPERFVPVAEATGLILELGAWVMAAACRQIAAWERQGMRLRVAVNLSAQQLRQTDLVEQVARNLRTHHVPPELLELEVTESEALADPEQACQVLNELRALGVAVALDDFGTGHSSLAYLKRLPVSHIKVDREFMRNVPASGGDTTLVRAVVALAHTMGLRVVVEGVETREQLQFLREMQCACYQGWLFAKALAPDDVALLYAAGADVAAEGALG
ncbi:EAL domain-containing protein [Diaphorobacter sp. JS3050]|uniref:putative bifunctional diguanylate cyclase/phosphodiesterase n=1 Tax=Diaphorobacter sp. JS3050 TaxID=2735554 RepID=UPI001555250F|nr:EAL domain-containing protein [Diaphorobacter sp. JS3050]QJY34295.1 EAL domain-containing protein [Diaphorobacter sp. JS3050]